MLLVAYGIKGSGQDSDSQCDILRPSWLGCHLLSWLIPSPPAVLLQLIPNTSHFISDQHTLTEAALISQNASPQPPESVVLSSRPRFSVCFPDCLSFPWHCCRMWLAVPPTRLSSLPRLSCDTPVWGCTGVCEGAPEKQDDLIGGTVFF